ncbi:MAG: YncE family protein [Promethearchaeota archaeon]
MNISHNNSVYNVRFIVKHLRRSSLLRIILPLLLFSTLTLTFNISPIMVNQSDIENQEITVNQGDTLIQGFVPFGIQITEDGKYAYICFDLSESIFKIYLDNFSIESVADLSNYFPGEFELITLDASEEKLFLYTPTWQKLLVLDTQKLNIIHTINDIRIIGLIRSLYGPYLITWDGGNSVRFINTETYTVSEFTDNQMFFVKIQESKYNPNIWYVVNSTANYINAGIYNYTAKEMIFSRLIPRQNQTQGIFDLEVLPNEEKMYIGTFGGWYPGYHAYGWLYSINLTDGEVKTINIDGGTMCLEASLDNQWLYVGTGWPIPNTNNLLMINTQSDTITNQINLGESKYGWHYTQINGLKINPANISTIFGTCADANAFFKVNLDNISQINSLVLNRESLKPHYFIKQSTLPTGYVLIHQSATAFELNLDTANITNVIKFPSIRDDTGFYSITINNTGRIFIPQGETILEVDNETMDLLKTHQLPPNIPSIWHIILSNNQKMIYSISQDPNTEGYQPDTFLAINTTTFQIEANLKLDGGGFNEKPYELPNSSKIYTLGGQNNGPVVIHVIDTINYSIIKTITFNESNSLGISFGPYFPFTYDDISHTLFVGATHVVLAIDTITDTIKEVIYLKNISTAIGIESNYLTYVNAIGLVYNPVENYLYITHLDRSFISIYDLNNSQFLPQVISLKGYFPNFVIENDDFSKIYTLNIRSDDISVIDTKSKTLEKIIDLHHELEVANEEEDTDEDDQDNSAEDTDEDDQNNYVIYGFQITYIGVIVVIVSIAWFCGKSVKTRRVTI